jgi:RNA polymerase sigma-70 factor (sigma-E family)
MRDAQFGEGFAAYAESDAPRLQRLAYTLTGWRADAEDLTQDTLLRVGLAWKRIDERGPHAYATTVMCRTAWRSRRRWPFEAQRLVAADDPYPLVDDAMIVRAEMRKLAPRQRAVLALRYFCDLSERETAAILNCSVGTVKSQSSKALRRLQQALSVDDSADAGVRGEHERATNGQARD